MMADSKMIILELWNLQSYISGLGVEIPLVMPGPIPLKFDTSLMLCA